MHEFDFPETWSTVIKPRNGSTTTIDLLLELDMTVSHCVTIQLLRHGFSAKHHVHYLHWSSENGAQLSCRRKFYVISK